MVAGWQTLPSSNIFYSNLFQKFNFNKIPHFNAKGLKLGHFAIFDMLFWFLAHDSLSITFDLKAELSQPKAAMRSPIPIERMHSFSHGH